MAAPVWVLSVDLQTKTATFQTGMADAAKSAKKAFGDIGDSAAVASEGVARGTTNVRAALGLLDNSIRGNHAAAMADLVREFKDSSFVMAAIPFGATLGVVLLLAGGIVELANKFKAMREEAEKFRDSQTQFGTATQNVFNNLDKQLINAEIRTDELNGDHLAALHKQLQLIDMTSMEDLVKSFETISKAADEVFKGIEGHLYTMGIGSAGAEHALQQFKLQYDALLSQGKDTEAGDLLKGTLATAEKVLSLQKAAKNVDKGDDSYLRAGKENPQQTLRNNYGVGDTDKEIQAQQQLIAVLRDQVTVQQKIADIKKTDKGNVTHTAANQDSEALFRRAQFEHKQQEQEEREADENYRRAIEALQGNERAKIDATERGSKERLAAIDAAIKEENARGLQETQFYRTLGTQRVEVIREMAAEELRTKEEAGKEAAAHDTKMAELQLAATREHDALINSARRTTDQQRMAQDLAAENAEYALKLGAFAREIAALDSHSKDYENKLKALQDREKELTQAHENAITQITDKAIEDRNARELSAMNQFNDLISRGLASVLMRHQSFAAMVLSVEDQIASGMLQNAIKSMMTLDMTKEKQAAAAARDGFLAGAKYPFPANIVMAPALGAAWFASVMAFEKGGMVPGIGTGDIVPAMLTPGEHVADKSLTDGLRGMVRNGGNSGPTIHLRAHYAPQVHALDAEGVDKVLQKHQAVFQRHFEKTLRSMNS